MTIVGSVVLVKILLISHGVGDRACGGGDDGVNKGVSVIWCWYWSVVVMVSVLYNGDNDARVCVAGNGV